LSGLITVDAFQVMREQREVANDLLFVSQMVESTEGSEKSGIAESQFRLLSNFALGRKRLPVN
jgi:hypothetical protein